ncbi:MULTISPECIES: hypothetical protein [Fluviispira]|jgi:hypothetical protein|uniref:HTH cro/C1-type domain-containing protein n=1 Tax=Fluviispira sanaruensis TaxID=2493639 RepID=A0A4P2VR77_FLUSA|nr:MULTISPECIES: hypothetical protein [Fluviispira]BBH54689.1 hypothetical protein JCM31447_31630 [Fluviispira sanaruensis]
MKNSNNWREIRKNYFTQKELHEIDHEVAKEAAILKKLQDSISKEVAAFMAKKNIGFNEFMLLMHSNPRQMSKIVKGDCNLTMLSIAELATVMGKNVKIVFE